MILFTGHGDIASYFSKLYHCDIISIREMSLEQLEALTKKYEVIVHNAANLYPASIDDAVNDNFILTRRLVNAIERTNPIIKLIYLSSMSILKNDEEYLDPLKMTPYAFSKYLAELYVLRSNIQNKCSVRFSTIFFNNPSKDGLSKLISDAVIKKVITIYNNGEAKRDFLPLPVLTMYLKKVCDNIITDPVLTIGSGEATSFRSVADFLSATIEGLKIENFKTENTQSVVCDFNLSGLKKFGLISFNLNDYIVEFLSSIKNANPDIQ